MSEIFPNPTVQQVIFQINFPTLFSIENKIGDIQEKIITKFPESNLLYGRQLLFADIGPEGKLEKIPDDFERLGNKMWQFNSPLKYKLNVLNNSLSIISEFHKTYNNSKSSNKFRDIIDYVLKNFFEVIPIPLVKRVGLRYIDECPIPDKNNEVLTSWYNTTFPITRYPINNAEQMLFITVTKKEGYNYVYREELLKKDSEYKLKLDFDCSALDIDKNDILRITDNLHDIISKEFFSIIKEPVKEWMRKEKT